ncbi:uncharacterized protein LOC111271509 isoform X2 [Varroa jacobsoni]|uniref:Uncharacterized protein n=1 Tax=Varroa destructor TaxID=109461 RepID=A0A7M7K1E9_VARDE|nr:uncharacterized protein LOC111249454 isoform X2 [Varroa destructor]XP_022708087.1 uncharacterized protein LOC111271509 isoform X2 [Varroa jacobsoni]
MGKEYPDDASKIVYPPEEDTSLTLDTEEVSEDVDVPEEIEDVPDMEPSDHVEKLRTKAIVRPSKPQETTHASETFCSRWKRSFQIGLATIIIVSAVLTLCFVIYRVMKDKFDPKESARAPPEIVSCEHQKEPIDMFSEKIQADVRTLESVIKSKAKSPSGRYRLEVTASVAQRAITGQLFKAGFVAFVFGFTETNLTIIYVFTGCKDKQSVRLLKTFDYDVKRAQADLIMLIPISEVIDHFDCINEQIQADDSDLGISRVRMNLHLDYSKRRLIVETCTLKGCSRSIDGAIQMRDTNQTYPTPLTYIIVDRFGSKRQNENGPCHFEVLLEVKTWCEIVEA